MTFVVHLLAEEGPGPACGIRLDHAVDRVTEARAKVTCDWCRRAMSAPRTMTVWTLYVEGAVATVQPDCRAARRWAAAADKPVVALPVKIPAGFKATMASAAGEWIVDATGRRPVIMEAGQ